MRHSIAKIILIVVLAKVDLLDSRAIEVVYTGNGCECPKNLAYQVNVPVKPPPDEYEIRSYGYRVEAPAPTKSKYTYSFDFVVEEPVQPPPKKVQKEILYAMVDKMVMPKPDCVVEAVAAACAEPEPSPEPSPKTCQYESTKVCTCGKCASEVEYVPTYSKSCSCGKCEPSNPQCRYVFSNHPSNRIPRSKRDVSPKKRKFLKFLRTYAKPFKATREAKKFRKQKIVKRDIKGEYDLLKKDQASLDLTIPEIIQYMPETLMPDFKRGKCNIGCKNCLNKHPIDQESITSPHNVDTGVADSLPMPEEPAKGASEYSGNPYRQRFPARPQFTDASYLKRSVNPYQYHYPCYPALMPPPYMSNPVHLPTYAQNVGYPSWYQPRPLIDPLGHYVFDRLGHKYEMGNEGLRLVTPTSVFEANVSAPVTAERTETPETEQPQGETTTPSADDEQGSSTDAPVVGAPRPLDPTYDPQMEKVIRDIIYKHPDFIDASQHAQGSITLPQSVQSDETMQFLQKLLRGRLNSWFGHPYQQAPPSHLQDLNRYSRETGASIKFIPVVTVDKERLDKYRKEQAQQSN